MNEVSDLSPQALDSGKGAEGDWYSDSWEAFTCFLGAELHKGFPQGCREEHSDPGPRFLWT